MSSLLKLDASFTISALAESVLISQTYSIKWRSFAWKFCRRPTKKKNQAYLYCIYCIDLIISSPYSTFIAENIKKHLKGRYQIIIKKPLNKNQMAINQQLRQYY
jgi:hypothetical protein